MNETYNYPHFRPGLLMDEVKRFPSQAPRPGQEAPLFAVRDTNGREWELKNLRDRPVVLIMGTASCPLTRGSAPALKELYDDVGDSVHWFTLYVREAHPG